MFWRDVPIVAMNSPTRMMVLQARTTMKELDLSGRFHSGLSSQGNLHI